MPDGRRFIAVIVNTPDGERIYTLRGADQPYRLIVQQMREGAVTLSADGTIVADIALPDEDGYSFIRRVRAHSTPAIQAVPAIAVTAYVTIPDRAEALAVGFQQHMAKPVDAERLIQAIHGLKKRSMRS